jgi:hypothetical protein
VAIANDKKHHILSRGITRPVIEGTLTDTSPIKRYFILPTPTFAIGLFIASISGGTVSIKAYTYDGDNEAEDKEVIDLGSYSTATSDVVITKSTRCLSRVRVEVTYTGTVDMRLMIRPLEADSTRDESAFVELTKDTSQQFNTIEAVRTQMTTTATQINVPDDAEYVWVKVIDPTKILWVGNSSSITANGADSYPVQAGEYYKFHLTSGNTNDLYGIVEEGTVYVYTLGGYNA